MALGGERIVLGVIFHHPGLPNWILQQWLHFTHHWSNSDHHPGLDRPTTKFLRGWFWGSHFQWFKFGFNMPNTITCKVLMILVKGGSKRITDKMRTCTLIFHTHITSTLQRKQIYYNRSKLLSSGTRIQLSERENYVNVKMFTGFCFYNTGWKVQELIFNLNTILTVQNIHGNMM